MENRYFIINANDLNIADIFAVSVGQSSSQRYSIDVLRLVIKLKQGDTNYYPFMAQYEEYTHGQILVIMQGDDWVKEYTF